MKQASPIAAAVYRLIPIETKQYSIYRFLTSEVLKMIKKGLDTETIIETLTKLYIEPLIKAGQKTHRQGIVRKKRRNGVLQHADQTMYFQNGPGFSNDQTRNISTRCKIVSPVQRKCHPASNTKEEKIPGLIYLGRLPECKNLKMWIRPAGFRGASG
jgi:hypothetical protein